LDGGPGNDRLVGDFFSFDVDGVDQYVGGVGADTFEFVSISNSPAATPDTIADFTTAAGDIIDLREIDADQNTPENDAFTFIDAAPFSNTAGELRYSSGFLEGDVDGDAVADFGIVLANAAPLTATDFIL
jgi:serralysin